MCSILLNCLHDRVYFFFLVFDLLTFQRQLISQRILATQIKCSTNDVRIQLSDFKRQKSLAETAAIKIKANLLSINYDSRLIIRTLNIKILS